MESQSKVAYIGGAHQSSKNVARKKFCRKIFSLLGKVGKEYNVENIA